MKLDKKERNKIYKKALESRIEHHAGICYAMYSAGIRGYDHIHKYPELLLFGKVKKDDGEEDSTTYNLDEITFYNLEGVLIRDIILELCIQMTE